jgi:threonyl-tRNA synthetase
MFGIEFETEEKTKQHAWQNSWGLTTRTLGVMVMTHSDDKGLVLPPRVAPKQVVIIPIPKGNSAPEVAEAMFNKAAELRKGLEAAVGGAACWGRAGGGGSSRGRLRCAPKALGCDEFAFKGFTRAPKGHEINRQWILLSRRTPAAAPPARPLPPPLAPQPPSSRIPPCHPAATLPTPHSPQGVRVETDLRTNYTPGWKYNHWEMRGLPLRVELGPRDMENGVVVVARRDTGARGRGCAPRAEAAAGAAPKWRARRVCMGAAVPRL